MEPELRISEPKHYGTREVTIVNLVSLIIAALLLVIMFVAGELWTRLALETLPYFAVAGIVPKPVVMVFYVVVLWALMAMVFIVPLPMVCNIYMLHLRRTRIKLGPSPSPSWFCQITLEPRLYSGSRGFWEGSDDVGYLCLSDEGLRFQGDHVECSIPWSEIRAVRMKRGKWWRGAGLSEFVAFDTDAFDGRTGITFMERSSLLLPSHRRITKEMFAALEQGIAGATP